MTESAAVTGMSPEGPGAPERGARRQRADAKRNVASLLEAAKAVFAASGVDAPAKEISDLAGVGVGTLYRHFPQRSDLVKAVLEHEIDACAQAAPELAAAHEPGAALEQWVRRYTEFLATKQGFAAALHSGDPAFDALPGYFFERVAPALGSLLEAAAAAAKSGPTSVPGTCCAPSPCCACRLPTRGLPTVSAWSPSLSTGCTAAPTVTPALWMTSHSLLLWAAAYRGSAVCSPGSRSPTAGGDRRLPRPGQ